MSIPVKYSATKVNNTIKANNIVFSNKTTDLGPTSSTGFYVGIDPPSSGYTIYQVFGEGQQPKAVVAHNDNEAIYFARSFGGTNINTIEDALVYFLTGSTSTTIVNMDYPKIITNDLVLSIDKNFIASYPRGGTAWNDLSGNNNNGYIYYNYGYTDFGNYDWANNITGITICVDVEKTGIIEGYAYHPIAKWNTITINTSFVLYHFGDASDGRFNILYTSSNDGWGGIYLGTLAVNQKAYFCFQWSSVNGGQGWMNGKKMLENRYGSGLLGVDGNTAVSVIGPSTYEATDSYKTRIHHVDFYNKDMSDNDVLHNYYSTVLPNIVTDGLCFYLDAGSRYSYPGSGTICLDLSGMGNDGTLLSGVTYNGSDHGGALVFAGGADSYVNCGSDSSLDLGSLTYDVWFKPVLGRRNPLISDTNPTSADGYHAGWFELYLNNQFVLIFGDGPYDGDVWCPALITTNDIMNVVCVRNNLNKTVKFYINNVSQYGEQQWSNYSIIGTPVVIGGYDLTVGGHPIWGGMNDNIYVAKIYNRALSATEISQNYNTQKGRFGL